MRIRVNNVSETILCADDTSVTISSRNFKVCTLVSNVVLSHVIKWFAANNLVINLDKMNIMKFIEKNSAHSTLHIGYKEKCIEERGNTKFLSLKIVNHINWKNHTEEMIPKLSGACFAIRSMVSVTLRPKLVYYASLYSIIKYGIYWGNSSNMEKILILYIYIYKKRELWLVHNPEPLVEVCINN
jgi:hypothetical protein